jgi:hypothetical protein
MEPLDVFPGHPAFLSCTLDLVQVDPESARQSPYSRGGQDDRAGCIVSLAGLAGRHGPRVELRGGWRRRGEDGRLARELHGGRHGTVVVFFLMMMVVLGLALLVV